EVLLLGEPEVDIAILVDRLAVVREAELRHLLLALFDVGHVHEGEVVEPLALLRGVGALTVELHELDGRRALLREGDARVVPVRLGVAVVDPALGAVAGDGAEGVPGRDRPAFDGLFEVLDEEADVVDDEGLDGLGHVGAHFLGSKTVLIWLESCRFSSPRPKSSKPITSVTMPSVRMAPDLRMATARFMVKAWA